MFARNMVEFCQGDEKKAFNIMKEILSECEKEYQLRMFFQKLGIYPGTKGHMSIEAFEELYIFFQYYRGNSALAEFIIQECISDEAVIYHQDMKDLDGKNS